MGLGTAASRVLGLVRESVTAAFFPKEVVDAFQLAFMIPNSFRRLTAEGAFSSSVISVFSKTWAKGDLAASQRFVRAVLGFSLLFLTLLAALGVVGAEQLTWLATNGERGDPEKFGLAVGLTRWMFPYVLLVSLVSLAMGLLNSAGRFFAPSFAPVLLNVAMIGCAVALSPFMPRFGLPPVFSLAVGVILGGAAQLVFQIPSLRAVRLLVPPSAEMRHPGLVQVLRLTGPMVFGAAAYQVGLFIANALAWSLGDGAVMYIQLSSRLLELPLAVLVMAISTAALPSLAALRGQGKLDEMKETFGHSLRLTLFVATPAMVALVVLAEPIIAILYQRGHFGYPETVETARALRYMSFGICSIALLRQTVPVYYALEQVWVPVVMSLVNIAAYVATALPLKGPLGHAGLCVALSVAPTVQAVGLLIVLRLRIGRLGLKSIMSSFARVLVACAPMATAVWALARFGRWSDGGNSPRNIAVLAATIAVGVAVYAGAAFAVRAPELRDLADAVRRRRRKPA